MSLPLLDLSHQLGQETRRLAILGEGNTSARLGDDTFLVKASGSHLGTLTLDGLTECRFDALLPLLEQTNLTDQEVDDALMAARVSPDAKKPSVEALFHAWLLTLPGVNFVGHTHPIEVNKILCTPHAKTYAAARLFPDHIVCGGVGSVFVPYTDPGLRLSQAIRDAVTDFVRETSRPPVIILLENHGLIALGRSPNAVLAATLMEAKAAEIYTGAVATCGGSPATVQTLTPEQIARIAGRPDEHYRQKMLNL